MYRMILGMLLIPASLLEPAYAASQGPNRLADGTVVVANAHFLPPAPAAGRLPMVRFPKQLAVAGIQGQFEADIVVSETGEVLDVTVKRRVHRQLDQGLVKLLRGVQFNPAILDGEPVSAIYTATYDFSLN